MFLCVVRADFPPKSRISSRHPCRKLHVQHGGMGYLIPYSTLCGFVDQWNFDAQNEERKALRDAGTARYLLALTNIHPTFFLPHSPTSLPHSFLRIFSSSGKPPHVHPLAFAYRNVRVDKGRGQVRVGRKFPHVRGVPGDKPHCASSLSADTLSKPKRQWPPPPIRSFWLMACILSFLFINYNFYTIIFPVSYVCIQF